MDQPPVDATSGKSYFWLVQLTAWPVLNLVNILLHQHLHTPFGIEVLNALTISGGGILITSLYRAFLKRHPRSIPKRGVRFLSFVALSSTILAFVWFVLTLLIFLPFFKQYSLSIADIAFGSVNLFFVILGWNLLYLGYQLVRNYHVSEIEKWQLVAEVQKAQLGALKAQINPHFMFNALNNIRALVLEDKEAARKMITQFAEILRYSLQFTERKEVSLSDELNMLRQYVDLLKIQYEHKLHFELAVDEAVVHHQLPPMLLQLLVENAVKHGIALSSDGGKILVDIGGTTDGLSIKVRNTGSLQQHNRLEESLGVGTANVSKRLQLLYGNRASLQMEEEPPMVAVTIKIAYE